MPRVLTFCTLLKLSEKELKATSINNHLKGNIKEAEDGYIAFINKGFSDADIYSNYALLCQERGELNKAIKLYESNNREDLSKIEQAELLILQSYIPEQMTEEKLKVEMIKIKDELLKENKLNIGELIKTTIKKFSSSADNSMISKIAKGLVNL